VSTTIHTALPKIAIVGRPNVGKSTLVNRIIGARKAIVHDEPRVTRDRSYHLAEWCGQAFYLVDTGGLIPDSTDFFDERVNQQVDIAIQEADVIVFLLDGRDGLTALDEEVASKLRQSGKAVVVGVNKIDEPQQAGMLGEFYNLGLGDPVPVSAIYGYGGVGDLLDEVLALAPKANQDDNAWNPITFTLVGRPNVGKSSLLNQLLDEERSIVSDIPGTTRDAIEAPMWFEDQAFAMVDTAGVRRKSKVSYGVEMFSVDRSIGAMRQADVTVLVLDAVDGVTDQDKRLMEASNQSGCGLIIVINKWDLIENKSPKSAHDYQQTLLAEIPHALFAPMLFVSAKTGQRVTQILRQVKRVHENAQRRIRTNLVNQVINEALSLSPPPVVKNTTPKVLYATQAGVAPPTFVLFMNNPKLLSDSYKRYLEKKLRENFEFEGTPVKIVLRARSERA